MIRTTRTTAVIVGCTLLFVASGVRSQDWPQWRGPNRDAKATGFECAQDLAQATHSKMEGDRG